MNNKIKEFWNRFGIKDNELILVMRILKKPENRNLSNQDKINIIKKIYQNKVNTDKEYLENENKKLNKIKFKLNVENNRLDKRKTEEKLFKSEDSISNYEELAFPIKKNINKRTKIFLHNSNILEKILQYSS